MGECCLISSTLSLGERISAFWILFKICSKIILTKEVMKLFNGINVDQERGINLSHDYPSDFACLVNTMDAGD
jgi:hypothetical protein